MGSWQTRMGVSATTRLLSWPNSGLCEELFEKLVLSVPTTDFILPGDGFLLHGLYGISYLDMPINLRSFWLSSTPSKVKPVKILRDRRPMCGLRAGGFPNMDFRFYLRR